MPGDATESREPEAGWLHRQTPALLKFIAESNRIEGILRPPNGREVNAHTTFLCLEKVTVAYLEGFVGDVAGVPLRRAVGQDVRVGDHIPPAGGPEIEKRLDILLDDIAAGSVTPFEAHVEYEHLHPFLDGNGRSGRVLWAWHMRRDGLNPFSLPFLHRFYYQSLDAARKG